MSTQLPGARAAFTDQSGRPTPEFYRFLEQLALAQSGSPDGSDLSAINAQLAELQAEIDAIPAPQALQVLPPLILNDGVLRIMPSQQTGARSLPRSWVFA